MLLTALDSQEGGGRAGAALTRVSTGRDRDVIVRGWPRRKRIVAAVGGGVVALVVISIAASLLIESESDSASQPTTSPVTQPPPTTAVAPMPPLPTVPGSVRAPDVLTLFIPQNEHHEGFDRAHFAFGSDLDGDGWNDPADVEILHVVGLEEAWDSGAWAWDDARRASFGNDVDDARTFRAVSGAQTRSTSDEDPSSWLPADESRVCAYLADWIAIKARWELSMDRSELAQIRTVIGERCPGLTIAPWPSAPLRPQPLVQVSPLPVWPQPIEPGCDLSYPTVCIPTAPPDLDCPDTPHRRFQVLPADPHRFDPDRNGIGCER